MCRARQIDCNSCTTVPCNRLGLSTTQLRKGEGKRGADQRSRVPSVSENRICQRFEYYAIVAENGPAHPSEGEGERRLSTSALSNEHICQSLVVDDCGGVYVVAIVFAKAEYGTHARERLTSASRGSAISVASRETAAGYVKLRILPKMPQDRLRARCDALNAVRTPSRRQRRRREAFTWH